MRRLFTGIAGALLLASCFLDSPIQPTEHPDELQYNYWLLQRLYYRPEQLQAIDTFYIKADSMEKAGYYATVDLDGLSEHQFFAVVRLYQSIPDPFTRYVAPEKADDQKQHDTSTVIQGGLGIEYTLQRSEKDSARIQVVRVYEDSPADSAGLLAGDRIFGINGRDIANDSAYSYFRKVLNDSIWIRPDVLRYHGDSVDTLHFDIRRGTVYVPTVIADSLEGIQILELRQFVRSSIKDGGSTEEFQKALRNTSNKGIRVLDLRGNPGGEVRICLDMADEFIDEKPMIHLISHSFSARGNAKLDTSTVMGTAGGIAENDPVVIAMDSNTASCAEIFIAALKANLGDKAILVGTNSYGKGIGQSHWDTPAKGMAVITSLEIRSPDWTNYHGVGIQPDIQANLDEILPKAVSLAQEKSGLYRKKSPSVLPEERLVLHTDSTSFSIVDGAWVDSTGSIR